MKKFSITVDAIVSTGDLHYMEDFPHVYLKIAPSGLISFVILKSRTE